MSKWLLPLILMLLVFATPAQADLYQWTDEEGNLQITDYPPPKISSRNTKVHKTGPTSGIEPSASEQLMGRTKDSRVAQEPVEAEMYHEVILYTTSWCPYCKKAKAFFEARRIPYKEYDIEKDKDAAERKKQLDTGSGVPFAIVNGESISGFSPAAYENALKKIK
jgi:glutaredoxin